MGGVLVMGVFMADGLRVDIGAHFGIEPSACIFPARFARQCQAPFSKAVVEFGLLKAGEVSDFLNSESMQLSLHYLTDSRDFSNPERRQKFCLLPRNDPENPVRFGLRRRNLRDQP